MWGLWHRKALSCCQKVVGGAEAGMSSTRIFSGVYFVWLCVVLLSEALSL